MEVLSTAVSQKVFLLVIRVCPIICFFVHSRLNLLRTRGLNKYGDVSCSPLSTVLHLDSWFLSSGGKVGVTGALTQFVLIAGRPALVDALYGLTAGSR